MITQFDDVSSQYVDDLTLEDKARVEGYIRRAERSLAALVGDLATYDSELVVDTVVDAVTLRLDNPRGYASETDGDYSYRYFKGSDGWLWPADWRALFGVEGRSVGVIATTVPCMWRGWLS